MCFESMCFYQGNITVMKVCTVSVMPVFKMQAGHVPYPAASYHSEYLSESCVQFCECMCVYEHVWFLLCLGVELLSSRSLRFMSNIVSWKIFLFLSAFERMECAVQENDCKD